jgi:hypothetical protein
MHAVSIEAGGIVPLPRVGGALSHAVGSIRNLPRHCQTGVCQAQCEPSSHQRLDRKYTPAQRG